jgi:2-iminobutanoate/2-iminopropanoate deaminase
LGLLPDHDAPTMVEGSAADQLRQALINARKVLLAGGATFDHVVKATLFLVDMGDFAPCNEVWVEAFEPPRPTRSAVAVAQLPLGARAEVELWAYAPEG